MTIRSIEDHALIGDTQTAALVDRSGMIDWLCLPRFDSPACFAALLGDEENGSWRIGPADGTIGTRRYRDGTLVLETEFRTPDGVVRLIDCMPVRDRDPDVVRVVEGVSGRVPMRSTLRIRFGYGRSIPWVRQLDGCLSAVAGPDAVVLDTPVATRGEGPSTVSDFVVAPGDTVPFVLEWHPSHERWSGRRRDALAEVADTERWWHEWVARAQPDSPWPDAVLRSLVTLKALTYAPTGGIVAAPTTSLPEQIGGTRNWDYRYCWLRDATLTLYSLLHAGYVDEAVAWRDWLLRAIAGNPADLQIMYGVAGERLLPESELPWLGGYEASRPVRIGNAAVDQRQLDVYGEVMDTLHQARRVGIPPDEESWELQLALMEFLEGNWKQPDEGTWEVRGPRRNFTHSKVMAWVAADRAVQAVEQFSLDGPADRWRRMRAEIHGEVCREAYDAGQEAFTQSYGRPELDAALLLLPQVGFLPATDARVRGTVAAVERNLCQGGLVHRYQADDDAVDGLPAGEGAFLACSFWLADAFVLQGDRAKAAALYERLLDLRNDVGLLAEEYDTAAGRMVGNFPQAFSHVALLNTARNLSASGGPAQQRPAGASASDREAGR